MAGSADGLRHVLQDNYCQSLWGPNLWTGYEEANANAARFFAESFFRRGRFVKERLSVGDYGFTVDTGPPALHFSSRTWLT